VTEIGGGDVPAHGPGPLASSAGRLALDSPLAATGGPHGQIVIVGSPPGAPASIGLVTQGLARGPFSSLARTTVPASPEALATGYLGDAALASPVSNTGAGTGIEVRIERYFAHAFGAPTTVPAAAAGSVQALSIAVDYRTDAIVAWRQGGAIYARDLPASGAAHATQRLGPASVRPSISALISDDNRAIVAWAEQRGTQTSVYLDTSSTGVRFGAAHLLESFTDPTGAPAPTSSPRLIRLSSESVMLAWTGAQSGHWVVRSAAIDLNGLRGVRTISPVGGDSLLTDLEPGPDGEALALWGAPQRTSQGGLDLSRQAIYAARGIDAAPGKTIFARPEQISPVQANSDPTVAFDPASDRALALWRGPGGGLEYAIRAPSAP
jgi:hypothetical protein